MLKVPLIPLKRNHKTQFLFMGLFVVVLALNLLITLPTIHDDNIGYFQLANLSTFTLVFLFFFIASCKNAGILKPDKQRSFLELLRDINPADLCPECKVIRSARSRHCAICNQCVERFDHHCPWINNCVGIGNHNAFLLFLFTIWFKIIFHIGIVIYAIIQTNENELNCILDDNKWCNKLTFNHPEILTNYYVFYSSCVLCIIICLFYLLLSSVLLQTHCQNYMANRTTNERFSRRRPTRGPNDTGTDLSSSVMSMSDFDNSDIMESMREDGEKGLITAVKKKKNKNKGCCSNCWRMSTHTKVVPQKKLYDYLAERSTVINDSQIITNSQISDISNK